MLLGSDFGMCTELNNFFFFHGYLSVGSGCYNLFTLNKGEDEKDMSLLSKGTN